MAKMRRQVKIKRKPEYRECLYCHGTLDAQEHCTCREQEDEETSKEAGQALQLKMEDWGQYRYAAR